MNFIEKYPIERWERYINFNKNEYRACGYGSGKIVYTSIKNRSKTIDVYESAWGQTKSIVYKYNDRIKDGFSCFTFNDDKIFYVTCYKNGKINSINKEPAIINYNKGKICSLKWASDNFLNNFEGAARIEIQKGKAYKSYYIDGSRISRNLFYSIKNDVLNKNYKKINTIKENSELNLYKEFAKYYNELEVLDYVDSIIIANKLMGEGEILYEF